MNRKRVKISRFTLVELLVSMGVFSILLLVSMQVFSSSRRLWLESERQNRVYADVRSALEFITSRLQTQAYSKNMPFSIKSDRMYFPTAIPMNRKKGENERDKIAMRFVGFHVENGVLYMSIYSDEGNVKDFQKNMPPVAKTQTDISSEHLFEKATEEYNKIELMDNVVKFELVPYTRAAEPKNAPVSKHSGELKYPPYRLDIKLTVADSKESFDAWNTGSSSEKADVENENCFNFTRSVLLNYRGAE